MRYIGTTINSSPTITGRAADALQDSGFLAAKFDADGKITKAGAGDAVLGLVLPDQGNMVDGEVTVQVKDIGLWRAGEAFAAGTLLASDAGGKAVEAQDGDAVVAMAIDAAKAVDAVVSVQIIKAYTA